MKEYDLFIPIGAKIPAKQRKLSRLKKELTRAFGGLTYFPHTNEGLWRLGGVTFRDEIIILRVISNNATKSQRYLKQLKARLTREWRQQEILIIARPVETI